MKVLGAFIAIYLLGYLVFTTIPVNANLDSPFWYKLFVCWRNISYGSIGAWASLYATGNPLVKKLVKPVFIFSIIMGAWQISTLYTGLDINNEWAVMAAFLVCIVVVSFFLFREFRRLNNYI